MKWRIRMSASISVKTRKSTCEPGRRKHKCAYVCACAWFVPVCPCFFLRLRLCCTWTRVSKQRMFSRFDNLTLPVEYRHGSEIINGRGRRPFSSLRVLPFDASLSLSLCLSLCLCLCLSALSVSVSLPHPSLPPPLSLSRALPLPLSYLSLSRNGMSFQLIWERPSHLESSKGRSVHPQEFYISDLFVLGKLHCVTV